MNNFWWCPPSCAANFLESLQYSVPLPDPSGLAPLGSRAKSRSISKKLVSRSCSNWDTKTSCTNETYLALSALQRCAKSGFSSLPLECDVPHEPSSRRQLTSALRIEPPLCVVATSKIPRYIPHTKPTPPGQSDATEQDSLKFSMSSTASDHTGRLPPPLDLSSWLRSPPTRPGNKSRGQRSEVTLFQVCDRTGWIKYAYKGQSSSLRNVHQELRVRRCLTSAHRAGTPSLEAARGVGAAKGSSSSVVTEAVLCARSIQDVSR